MGKEVGTREYFGAILKKVSDREGKNGPYLMWEFTDDNGDRRVGFTDSEIIVGNRTWTWLFMLGISLHVGDILELQDLQDLECFIFLDDKGTVRMVAETLEPKQVEAQPETTSTEAPKPIEQPKKPGQSEAGDLFS